MYIVAGEFKTVIFLGPSKSHHLLATSFYASRVDGALTRDVQLEVKLSSESRRGVVALLWIGTSPLYFCCLWWPPSD